jgi:hypothetical protein
MTRRLSTRLAFGSLVVLLLAGALAWTGSDRGLPPRAEAKRPPLMLVTTLPIVFPEEFTLRDSGSKTLSVLEGRYRVIPIGTTDRLSLGQARLLMMAHPLAQPAEDLVALDDWLREGGRLLLLADPRLEWPSSRPLGDKLRPPPSFADTGLLAHWGLRLDAPEANGLAMRQLGSFPVQTRSPGRLVGRGCKIGRDGFVAYCEVGQGRITVIADADFLRLFDADGQGADNANGLLSELAALER